MERSRDEHGPAARVTPRAAGGEPDGRIIIVSNRGPHDFVWRNDRWVVTRSSGGLVSMLEPLARRPDVSWYCCVSEPPAAGECPEAIFTTAADQIDAELGIVPVPLPASVYRKYYGLISNEVLWMLQHHLVGQFGYQHLDQRRHRAWTEGYLEANRRLADALAGGVSRVRGFLVQDYHLFPLPALLRTAQAMAEALTMPRAERAARLNRLRARVLDWTAERWLAAQLEELLSTEK